ncbi:MAG: hypothetical protein SWZ49_30215 [Cyanobacteriota bacterium]|nr:hypothetical protein [Cyanobacteriota bacterium]
MNASFNLDKEQKAKLFKEITDCFIGKKASLFAYSPGFEELYILVEKGGRYFLIKFMETRYLKVCQEWIFAGLKIELQPEKVGSDLPCYKIYDRHYLEVFCLHFWIFEILEGEDVVNASINRENRALSLSITHPKKFQFANIIKNKSTTKITDDFPELAGAEATLFPYHRWNRLLFFKISGNRKQDDLFLVCHNCGLIEYDGYIYLDKVPIIKDANILILKEPSSKFILKCTVVEIWDRGASQF